MNSLIKQIVESKFNFNIDIDNKNQNTLSKSKYNSVTLEKLMLLIELDKYTIDLGLPSGTLWCKYNLGCDYNLLNNNPELSKAENWYGNYYAWGETKTKTYYDWVDPNDSSQNYKYAYNYDNTTKFTKYCNNKYRGYNGYVDKLIELLPEDDAAYQNMRILNLKFHIPTKELCEELLEYTDSSEFIENYAVNEKIIIWLNGWELISRINGNKLFIPASGTYVKNYFTDKRKYGELWTSSLLTTSIYNAWFLSLCPDISYNKVFYQGERDYGRVIRPVINLDQSYE